MGNQNSVAQLNEEEQRAVLDFNVSVKAIADKIKQMEVNQECGVVVMVGAGISVSAGIPGLIFSVFIFVCLFCFHILVVDFFCVENKCSRE
jgi:hypothetical protein